MEELKTDDLSDSKAQEEKEEAEVVETEEDFESLPEWAREKFKKVEEDRDNYRKGLLKWKSEARTLKSEPEKETEEQEEEQSEEEWDEASKRFKEETIAEAKRNAEEAARNVIAKEREKLAIEKFTLEHPEMADDGEWQKVVANYKGSGGISVKSIQADLEAAYEKTYGKVDEDKVKQKVKEGITKAQLADAHTISNVKTHGRKAQKTGLEEMESKFEGNLPPGF